MSRSFPVKTAEELIDQDFFARWRDREAIGADARRILATVVERFVADGGPVEIASLITESAELPNSLESDACVVRQAVAELDQSDLLLVDGARIVLAYPFASTPTAFLTLLDDGRQRYACCAIDALGIPALLHRHVHVRSRCHHCGESIELRLSPERPLDGGGVMTWVGRRQDLRAKACASL